MKRSVMLKELTRLFGGKYEISPTICYLCHKALPHPKGDSRCNLRVGHKHFIKVK